MKLAPALFVLLTGSAIAATACTVTEGDGDGGSGGEAGTTNTGGTNTGGTNTGGSAGGNGGSGGGTSCEQACADASTQASLDLWDAMVGCTFCGACYTICDDPVGSVCEAGTELGCSAGEADCSSCVNSDCAQLQQCGTEVDACAADQGCLDFNDCYAACP